MPDGWNVGIGAEGEVQRDDRLETSNEEGEPGADVLTDQIETVRAGAVFARVAIPLGTPALTLTAATRLDALRYEADDQLGMGMASGSGARTVTAVSPALGLAYRWRAGCAAGLLYANAAGALDAPTTTELGNRPDGSAGFNPDLDPERTWGLEAGMRGAVTVGRATAGFDVAAFAAWVDRLLLPFEVDDVTFYRNAGRTRHAGLETALDVSVPDVLRGSVEAAVSYAWTQARFTEDADLVRSGAEVPGFPEHLVSWRARWQHRQGLPLVVAVEGEAASAYFADDENTAATDAYAVVHARVALAGLALGRGLAASPFLSLRNVFDVEYAGSVVVNAFGARYYEPAAGRHVLVGLALTLY
jgi:iron complex outermembrane receptor protein